MAFSVSDTGVLAHGVRSGNGTTAVQLAWVDRQGQVISALGQPQDYHAIDLSPDGRRLATNRHTTGAGEDVWIVDATRGDDIAVHVQSGATEFLADLVSRRGAIVFSSLRDGKYGCIERPQPGPAAMNA